ncbi:MAG: 2-isopropylmalate synthase [bacterium]|nr:2-isopropylmalate synthase [bacterium]
MKKEDKTMSKIYIFDTTLRDGEQAPGFSMSIEAKVNFARQLAKLNVDAIEAGFPVSSPVQFEAVRQIARTVKGPRILGLARTVKADIKAAADAVKSAKKSGIHTFISTSPIHMKHKLRKTPREVLKIAVESVKYARSLNNFVEFSAEDATRSEPDFLKEIISRVIAAGASVINIPDTVGYSIPEEFGSMISDLISDVPELNDVIVSVHCHNDLGLAVANSLAGVKNGVTQVECTVNGIGERAGNASLEEIVMGLDVRKDYFGEKATQIRTEELYPTSRLLTHLTGIAVQPNKAIVGENAFAHESGIHQDGFLKHAQTYEIMKPEHVGRKMSSLVLGRHSGRHGLKKRILELGYKLNEKDFEYIYGRFIEISDKKKEVFDDDLIAILNERVKTGIELYKLDYFHISSGKNMVPTATIKLIKQKQEFKESAWGDGPVDAVYNAIDKIVGLKTKLEDYSIRALSSGQDAMGVVHVNVKHNNEVFPGSGSSTDIIEASALAYLNSLNRILVLKKLNHKR